MKCCDHKTKRWFIELPGKLYYHFNNHSNFFVLPLLIIGFDAALALVLCLNHQVDEGIHDAINEAGKAKIFFFDFGGIGVATQLVNMVSGAAITVVTLTFTLTVLSVQLAAQAYTPRLLDEFLKDPVPKISIGLNLGAWMYSFIVSYNIGAEEDTGEPADIPYIAVNILILQGIIVLFNFVFYIHYFVNSLRLERILRNASRSALQAVMKLSKENEQLQIKSPAVLLASSLQNVWDFNKPGLGHGPAAKDTYFSESKSQVVGDNGRRPSRGRRISITSAKGGLVSLPMHAIRILSPDSGYVHGYCLEEIVDLCEELDFYVKFLPHIGEFVTKGTIVAFAWDKTDMDAMTPKDTEAGDNGSDSVGVNVGRCSDDSQKVSLADRILEYGHCENIFGENEKFDAIELNVSKIISPGIIFSHKRSRDNDVSLGIQQLSDIAVRALSAAINDPQTAIQCLDSLSAVFGRLALQKLTNPLAVDSTGTIRCSAPRRSFAYLFSILDPIRHYGKDDVSIVRRGVRLCGDIAAILKRHEAVDSRVKKRTSAVLRQLEQWVNVGESQFGRDSPEFKSILYVREHCRVGINHACDRFTHAEEAENYNEALEVTLTDTVEKLEKHEGLIEKSILAD